MSKIIQQYRALQALANDANAKRNYSLAVQYRNHAMELVPKMTTEELVLVVSGEEE